MIETYLRNLSKEDYTQLRKVAFVAKDSLLPLCKQKDPKHNGFQPLFSFAMAVISVDKELTEQEYRLMSDVLGVRKDQVKMMFGLYQNPNTKLSYYFGSGINDDNYHIALLFASAFAVVDGSPTDEELTFIYKCIASMVK